MAEDREIGTVHSAKIATAAFFRSDDMRWVIALGIEGGRERQNLGWAELHAEAARLATLHDDANCAFRHAPPVDNRCLLPPSDYRESLAKGV
jgi:hypothetical protein